MKTECNYDCVKYESEPFIDESGNPYCRWCGDDIKGVKDDAKDITHMINKNYNEAINEEIKKFFS